MKLKFIQLNIWEGGKLFANILNFLKAEDPDIICFQEVYNGTEASLPPEFRSIEVLTQNLPEYNYAFDPELLSITPHGKIDVGNAIFSRYPIRSRSVAFFNAPYGEYDQVPASRDWSQHPKGLQHALIDVQGQTVHVINLHGIWGVHGNDTPERLQMSDMIVQNIKDQPKTIMSGDFNVNPNTQTISNIEKHLHNVFKGDLETSFNLKHKDLVKSPGYATSVVDMVFVSHDIKVMHKNCPPVDVSDHVALVCELEI